MKLLKTLLATAALSVLFVTPVFATEGNLAAETNMLNTKMTGFKNDISTLVTFDLQCGAKDVAFMHGTVDQVTEDVIKSNIAEEQNYIAYLKARLGNAIETERIKKENVGSMTELVKVNKGFQPQLDAAIAEYNKAVAEHQAAIVAIDEANAYFAALNQTYRAKQEALNQVYVTNHVAK